MVATCERHLESYLLERDIREVTEAYYRRVVSVFLRWATQQTESLAFNSTTVSRFLRDQQIAGKSSYYRRSLRSGLVALLRHAGDTRRVRTVKLDELERATWSTTEVCRLIAASRHYQHRDETYWATLIEAAYYSGLSQVDLERLTRSHFDERGVVVLRRSRTGKRAVAYVPPTVLDQRPTEGLLWKRPYSAEMFRRHFARIVNAAGLTGTFKRLRKSSGTGVEQLHPGRGHEHLANERDIFERHYLSREYVRSPLRPPPLDAD